MPVRVPLNKTRFRRNRIMSDNHPLPTSPNFQDLTGKTFGWWTVINYSGKKGRCTTWFCQCRCGRAIKVHGSSLKNGGSTKCKSCALRIRNTVHGKTKTTEYNSWVCMKNRCHNPKDDSYHWYGARGISVFWIWVRSQQQNTKSTASTTMAITNQIIAIGQQYELKRGINVEL